jgi:hypothetical protein
MKREKSGREEVIDTVAFVSNLKVVCFLERSLTSSILLSKHPPIGQ